MHDEQSSFQDARPSLSILSVVSAGACVGCGACTTATSGAIPIRFTSYGTYEAELSGVPDQVLEVASRVCPFADESRDERQIASEEFGELNEHDVVGRYRGLFAGRLADETELVKSSSGALTSWLVAELLARGDVDGVIHVGDGQNRMFEYTTSYSVTDVLARRKSRYYAVSFAEILRQVEGDGRTYAFVGIPCMIHGARLVAEQSQQLKNQLKYFVGIVCGHLKSTAYAESFAWQLGIPPNEIESVDFRVKDPHLLSRQYSFRARALDGHEEQRQTIELVGGNWGHSVFQLNACNYCEDIFAESADVVFGDAWLPRYEADWRGTNVVVSRNAHLNELLLEGKASGAIQLDVLDVDSVAATQAGNVRHRRAGLAIRIADDDRMGTWRPLKRTAPSEDCTDAKRIAIVRGRVALAALSHRAFSEAKALNSLTHYLQAVEPVISGLNAVGRLSIYARLSMKVRRTFWRGVRALSEWWANKFHSWRSP